MTDIRTVHLVVIFLGVFAIGGLAGCVWLLDRNVDPTAVAVIAGLTGTAVGGIGGILSNSKSVDVDGLARLGEVVDEV